MRRIAVFGLWISTLVAVWLTVLSEAFYPLCDCIRPYVIIAPILAVIVYGLYALLTVIIRAKTMNDMDDAASELKQEIEVAEKSLREQGIRLRHN